MKITYYLGAGASYHAVPTVLELDRAFKEIEKQSKDLVKEIRQADLIKPFKIFEAQMQTGAQASKRFGTIDTYAKHLWLTNELDLNNLKKSLSLFFSIWQETDKNYFNNKILRNDDFEDIDHRYLGLFANYLEKKNNEILLNENVNIITWNYDNQIEKALSLFSGKHNLQKTLETFGIFPYKNSTNETANIIHLNGVAGLFECENSNTQSFITESEIGNRKFIDVLIRILKEIQSETLTNKNFFSFAWERNRISSEAISRAEIALKNTDILVIIGYSFPTFNDEVDKRLFKILENSNKLKTIYYQDPNANKEILNTRFGIKDNKIKIIQKTEQFVLPLETSYFNKPGTSIYNLGNVKPNSEHRY